MTTFNDIATDVTGKQLFVGDLVLFSSGYSAALLAGHVTNIRERYMSIVSVNEDKEPDSSLHTRKPSEVCKLSGPEYDNVPVEWLKVMFPTVK